MTKNRLSEMSAHIIDVVFGWRKEDYDGYNDYYVNPEYHRCELIRRRSRINIQEDETLKQFDL